MTTTQRTGILSLDQIERKIRRMAHQINEAHHADETMFVVGVDGQGYEVARRLADELRALSQAEVLLHKLSLDKQKPWSRTMAFDGDLASMKDQIVVLVDDVLNSGKTLMYSAHFLLDAHPRRLATATLVDRIHRMFPIRADYVGLTLSTNLKEHIAVEMEGKDAGAYLS